MTTEQATYGNSFERILKILTRRQAAEQLTVRDKIILLVPISLFLIVLIAKVLAYFQMFPLECILRSLLMYVLFTCFAVVIVAGIELISFIHALYDQSSDDPIYSTTERGFWYSLFKLRPTPNQILVIQARHVNLILVDLRGFEKEDLLRAKWFFGDCREQINSRLTQIMGSGPATSLLSFGLFTAFLTVRTLLSNFGQKNLANFLMSFIEPAFFFLLAVVVAFFIVTFFLRNHVITLGRYVSILEEATRTKTPAHEKESFFRHLLRILFRK